MIEILTRKLEGFVVLSDEDKALVECLETRTRVIDAKQDIISEGESPSDVHLIASGFGCRYKMIEGGKRQIVGFLAPGDFCDLHVFILRNMDHSIATLARSTVIDIPRASILQLLERPALSKALLMTTLVDEAVLRDWVANIGQRAADRRIAHLFCELHARLKVVGLTEDGRLELPLSQTELADTVGLSNVHVNRSLQTLREEKLITLRRGMLEIPDIAKLRQISGFRANYLHIDHDQSQKL